MADLVQHLREWPANDAVQRWSVVRSCTAEFASDRPEYLASLERSMLREAAAQVADQGLTLLTSSGPVWEQTSRPPDHPGEPFLTDTRPWKRGEPIEREWVVCRMRGLAVPLPTGLSHGMTSLYGAVASLVASVQEAGLGMEQIRSDYKPGADFFAGTHGSVHITAQLVEFGRGRDSRG